MEMLACIDCKTCEMRCHSDPLVIHSFQLTPGANVSLTELRPRIKSMAKLGFEPKTNCA